MKVRAVEIRVGHAGHGDQEMAGEVDGLHDCHPIVICIESGRHLGTLPHYSGQHIPMPDRRPLLVPPRPARQRQRRPALRAGSPGRCTAPSSSTAKSWTRCRVRPTGASSSSRRASAELQQALRSRGGGLIVLHGGARDEIPQLAARAPGRRRLRQPGLRAGRAGARRGRRGRARGTRHRRPAPGKDQRIFARDEILTQAGRPFVVFTPYKRAWLAGR